jgi:hypothetical protein
MTDPNDGADHSEPVEIVDPIDGTRWKIDIEFVSSNWSCLWGAGCPGILDRPAPELEQGCCSVGAQLLDDDEAKRVSALGLTLDPERFQFQRSATDDGVIFVDETTGKQATRVVDGACIFLNRPGFSGGAGCALHLGADDDGESPIDWKPSVCWQLPLKVDDNDDGTRTLRRWRRNDWGPDADLAWCCTEANGDGPDRPSAYIGQAPVAHTMADEIEALVGPEVAAELAVEVAVEIERRSGGVG